MFGYKVVKEEKKIRSDKKIRVNPALSQDTHEKLVMLSVAVNMPKTQLAAKIIDQVVNSPNFIEYIQDKYRANPQYRVVPIMEDGKVYYRQQVR